MVLAALDLKLCRTHGHSRPLDIRVPLLQHNTGCERDLGAWDRPLPRQTPLQKVGLLLGVFICHNLHVHTCVFAPILRQSSLHSKYSHLQQHVDHRCTCSRTLQNQKNAERGATGSLKLLYDEAACYFLWFAATTRDC